MVHFFLGNLEKGRRAVRAGAIDQDIHAPLARLHFVGEGEEPGSRGDLAGLEARTSARGLDGGQALFRFGRVTADEDNVSACGSHAFGHRTTKFARAADDHGRFSGEAEKVRGSHDLNAPRVHSRPS